ncbi:FAD/FMN-dependent dehydrogenase [Thermus thermophilus]|nr:FAD/FMN-dependent dehydrogenase [Thermus thermophilus]
MRHRFGGLRDFLLGVRFVDGEGRVVRGGGKVVKNAAGFPFHRLMVGSLGAFGVMVELSFKVFPRPRTTRTLRVRRENLEEALADLERLRLLPLDLLALDLVPRPPWSFAWGV